MRPSARRNRPRVSSSVRTRPWQTERVRFQFGIRVSSGKRLPIRLRNWIRGCRSRPGDVHRGDRQPHHDDRLRAGAGRRERASLRCSPDRSPSGSGSPCSSPTSPRRWPKGGVRRQAAARSDGEDRDDGCAAGRGGRAAEPSRASSAAGRRHAVRVEAGQIDPGRRRDHRGGWRASDESAIAGESAPVIREAGGDRSGVTGGTQGAVGLDRRSRITSNPGETFVDPPLMCAWSRARERQKTPKRESR